MKKTRGKYMGYDKEKAENIRIQLKKIGLKRNDVSVRIPHCGCIRVKIISDLARKFSDKIKEIAKSFEKVDYCHVTHEILSGGNCFIFVSDDNNY
jgi:hypothetical protein